jgi:hypothetical protein
LNPINLVFCQLTCSCFVFQVGKRSALKSLPSNVRQASTEGGRTPTGKLNIRGIGVVQVGSPAIQRGDEGE